MAANFNFSVGAKTQKISLGNFFYIPSNMCMCKWFFKDATKILNGHQKSTLIFVVGTKT